ncbi:hypothetical protein AVEN_252074-1 [Araneus ventricosus]|uniref:Uncharacterized protein n=1 Tax=Araneus ventricosus TaxID=182803 RepID=A0A4Y2XAT1_ARAVE|nr:hypothetical protein AVEN_252074-1 [Araneus ventricosus]
MDILEYQLDISATILVWMPQRYAEDPPSTTACWTLNMLSWIKHSSACVVRKFGDGVVSVQVSSSSTDRSSKLRGQTQINPRVASKRDVY